MKNPTIVKESDVPLPLRDGVVTLADVYRPAVGRSPVLLARQSYSKNLPLTLATAFSDADPYKIARRGYAVVIQDGRGAPAVGGDPHPFLQEIDDGYDSVEWCAAQSWSDGRVGMVGRSYLGATPWLAAVARPPSLRAIAPGITSSGTYGWAYQDNVFQLGFALTWAVSAVKPLLDRIYAGRADGADARRRFERASRDLTGCLEYLPLKGMPALRDASPPNPYYEWLEHPEFDEYWEATDLRHRYATMDVAAFNMGGWYDLFVQGTLENFSGMVAQGSGRGRQSRLLVGPWGHDNPYRHYLGALNFGPQADPHVLDLDGLQLRFFDHWLKDVDSGLSDEPPVRIFVMGENVWRFEREWPLGRTSWTRYFLRGSGTANGSDGDGSLSQEPPGGEPPDTFVYDPRDPVPTWGGPSRVHGVAPKGPVDQRRIERRADVLVYTSTALERDVEVTGPVEAVLWAVTSARDTDFTAKLCDVYPDGRSISLTDGIVRARYRDSLRRADPIPPGEAVRYKIRLGSTSNLFRRGHRIRLEISSSNFPRFDRNLNTGGPFGEEAGGAPAQQLVLHDASCPSHVVLPVIPR